MQPRGGRISAVSVGALGRCGRFAGNACLIALLGAAGPAPARTIPLSVLPGVGPGAARVVVDPDQAPWRGVVLVQTEVGLRCTGALLGPRLVLTAAHCLFGRGTGRLVRPGSVHILTGYSHGAYAGHARAVSIEVGPRFALGPDGQRLQSAPAGSDWAVVTIDEALGTADRILPLARELPPPGTPARLGGYEQDRAQVIVADLACTVVDAVRDGGGGILLRHSCAGTRGVSGAPLLTLAPGGAWAVAGVAITAERAGSGGYAVSVSTIGAPELDALR